jgi:hypothetical protein
MTVCEGKRCSPRELPEQAEVIWTAYLARLTENVRVVHHLSRHHPELLAEFQRIVQLRDAA